MGKNQEGIEMDRISDLPSVVLRVEREGNLRFVLLVLSGCSVLFCVLSVPLILGVVPPNGWYGVRTATTMQDTATWYAANTWGGWVLLVASLGYLLCAGSLWRWRKRIGVEVAITSAWALWLGALGVALGVSLWGAV